MPGRVEGKVAFVTGIARGQGRAHAIRLAEEGADIVGLDICAPVDPIKYPMASNDDLTETAKAVEATGRRIVVSRADVRDLDAVQAVVAAGVARFGAIDIVSANAAVFLTGVATHETTQEQWRTIIDVNLTGAWHVAKAVVPHLIERGHGGSIIITGSTASLKAPANVGAYAVSKHGLVGLMRALAVELAPHSIRVNMVHPTTVSTPMILNEMTYRVFLPDAEHPTADQVAGAFEQVNLLPTPWVEPRDVSNAVLYLASDESRFVTGTELKVDAGNLLK